MSQRRREDGPWNISTRGECRPSLAIGLGFAWAGPDLLAGLARRTADIPLSLSRRRPAEREMLRVSEDGGRRRREAHAAGYGELGRALLDLQAAADQVFDAVTARTAEEREKLSAISRRISAAKAKIKTLSQSEEPLTIVSPAHHLSSCTNQEDFRPLFHDKCNDNSGGASIATISVNGGFNREYGLEGTLELFQFFSEENCDYTPKEGRLKVKNKPAEAKDDTYLGSLLDKSNFPTPQNISMSGKDMKIEELPPPPPSLISKHLAKNQRSDDVRFKSSRSPAHSDIPSAENRL